MNSVTVGATAANYLYNALGELVKRTGGAPGTVHYVYDEAGHLLGEYNSSGALIQETIWLGDTPVATLRPGSPIEIYYVHTDHLNTPRKVTRPSDNAVRWTWESDPFGESLPNENPASVGAFAYNLRFPGQVYDSHTGLNYNYFRDYDAVTGRYVQSDPIGLGGGINTYGYVAGNPLTWIDPLGLFEIHAYPSRASGQGAQTVYEFDFDPIREVPGSLALRLLKSANRLKQFSERVIDTQPSGPLHPYRDFLECGLLDADLEREYTGRFGRTRRHTQEQALDFLTDMLAKYPQLEKLYPRPADMLDKARENMEGGWFYNLTQH